MNLDSQDHINYFAETDARNKRIKFGIKGDDRSRHMYIIGKTGMGKSTLLENLAIQDIENGEGLAFIDPHGGTAEKLLEYVPPERVDDVLYFAPFDMEHPVSFNVIEDVGYDKRHLVVSGLMNAFEKIWADQWSARMEYILNNVLLALLEYPDSTLLDVNRMLVDKNFRKLVVENVTDPLVESFWTEEFAGYTDRYAQEATPAIQNKVGQFTSNPLIRNIVGQPNSTFDLREIMDNKKIFIANLSKGRMGETNADLLGSMLITRIYLAAMSRANLGDSEIRKLSSFYFYVDEFQSFANKSFADILSEARKYKLSLTIAHQYIEQMSEEVRAAVFGNVGTMVAFRTGAYDAEVLEKEFNPEFSAEDLVNLGFAQIYLKLMINGVSSRPFSAVTLPPIEPKDENVREKVIESSRAQFARDRDFVESCIKDRRDTDFGANSGSEKNGSNNKNNSKRNNSKNKNKNDCLNNKNQNNKKKNAGFLNEEKEKEKKIGKSGISLTDLKEKAYEQTKKDEEIDKSVKEDHMNKLREALSSVMEKPKEKVVEDISSEDEIISSDEPASSNEVKEDNLGDKKGEELEEVSTEMLKEILKVEGEEKNKQKGENE